LSINLSLPTRTGRADQASATFDSSRQLLPRIVTTWLGAPMQQNSQLGWRLADSATAIQPAIGGGNAAALALPAALGAQGLWVPGLRRWGNGWPAALLRR